MLWSFADSIRKWSRANPANVSGCIWTVRRDRGLLLFGGHLIDLVVVWWPFAVTGSSSGAECHLGLVWGHLMDLVVRAFFCICIRICLCMCMCFCICICLNVYLSCLVLSRFVLSRLVSSRLVSSCVFSVVVHGVSSEVSFEIAGTEQLYQARRMIRGFGNVFFWTNFQTENV